MTVAAFKHGKFYGFKILYYHTLLATLMYLSMDKPVYFRALLKYLDWTAASFIPLPQANADKVACSAIASWYFSGISCFFYDNLRKYIVLFAIIVLGKNILSAFNKKSISSLGNPTFMDKMLTFMDSNFFMQFIWAVGPIWMIAAFTNIYYGSPSQLMGFGSIFSVIILLAYLCYFFIGIVKVLNSANPETRNEIGGVASTDQLRGQKISRFEHLVDFVKTILFAVFIVFIQQKPLGQAVAVSIVFAVSLIFLIAVRPYRWWVDTVFVALIEATFLAILIFNTIVASKKDSIDIQVFEKDYATVYFVIFFIYVALLIIWFVKLFFKPKSYMPESELQLYSKPDNLRGEGMQSINKLESIPSPTPRQNDVNPVINDIPQTVANIKIADQPLPQLNLKPMFAINRPEDDPRNVSQHKNYLKE